LTTSPALPYHCRRNKALSAMAKTFQCTLLTPEKQVLDESPNWQKTKKADQDRLLREAGIAPVGELSIGDDALLITALGQRSLPVWAAMADALPERFRQAALAAAKLLEPKTQSVKLTSGTLKTPEDVKAWVGDTETELLAKLRQGPIVIN